MTQPVSHPGDYSMEDRDADTFYCPVCGITLSESDFRKPEVDYYCPFCGTRQTPSRQRT